MNEPTGHNLPLLLTREMVAEQLQTSKDSVIRLEKAGRLKRIMVGERSVRYGRSQVLALIQGTEQ